MATTVLNKEQEKAVKILEAAFEQCKKANLSIIGMDNNLHVYDKKQLKRAERDEGCLYEAQYSCGQGVTVNTHKVYLDSGGW